MKMVISLLCLATLIGFGCKPTEAKVDVPAAVLAKFNTLYPDVKNAKWEKEENRYDAEFKVNGVETEVQFQPDGNLFLTETEIEVSALPAGVTDYVNQNMPGKKIAEASKLVSVDGIVTYEAEVDHTDYIFDGTGVFISKEVEDEKGEKGEDDK
jgi:hypothetical protein